MLRCLELFKSSIVVSESANTLNVSGLIRGLIGRDVPIDSPWLDEEDVSSFTTIHQAAIQSNITKPMETIKTEKRSETA